MFISDFVMGAGPQLDPSGFSEAGFVDDIGQMMGPGGTSLGVPGYGGYPMGGIGMLFRRPPYGMSPYNMRAWRAWRTSALIRLALLVFLGLPLVCVLLFYGFGAMGDAFGAMAPHLPEALRPYAIGAHDMLVSLRDVVSPYVGGAMARLSDFVSWLRSLIESLAAKGGS